MKSADILSKIYKKNLDKNESKEKALAVKSGWTTGVLSLLFQARWLSDAYSYNSTIEDIGNIPTDTRSGAGFFPWPHSGEKVVCNSPPPSYIECMPHGVPDMDPISKIIHNYLSAYLPLSKIPMIGQYHLPDLPVSAVGALMITSGAGLVVYKLINWKYGRKPYEPLTGLSKQ